MLVQSLERTLIIFFSAIYDTPGLIYVSSNIFSLNFFFSFLLTLFYVLNQFLLYVHYSLCYVPAVKYVPHVIQQYC